MRLDRPDGVPARAAAARHRRLGLAAGRRRHARRALRRNVVPREVYDAMVEEVATLVQDLPPSTGAISDGFHMLGTSGTVTTIAGVFLRLRRYDRRRVDGCWLSDDEVSRVVGELMAMSFDERAANPCIGAERADLVLAGCAILDAIRRFFPCARLRVADRGLREGMLVEMMRADGVWGDS